MQLYEVQCGLVNNDTTCTEDIRPSKGERLEMKCIRKSESDNRLQQCGKQTGEVSGKQTRIDTGTFLTQTKSLIPKLSGFLLKRYGLYPRQIHVGFLVEKAAI